MKQFLDIITMRQYRRQVNSNVSAQDILIARGDQLHVLMLCMVFVYAIFFSVANFIFRNFPQAYLTMIPIPLEVLFYYFFRKGGRWNLISKMTNLLLIVSMLAFLKLFDGPSTGILAFFIPVIVGSMITLQGNQRPYAWLGISITLVVLGFLALTDIQLYSNMPVSETKLVQERVQNYLGAAIATIFQVGFLIWVSNELQDKLVEKEQEKQRLITRMNVQSQEKQRNEVAIELHENINQILASAKMNLSTVLSDENRNIIKESEEYIEYALFKIRKLYHTLATPDLKEFDLADLIRQMIDELFMEEDVRVIFDARLDSSHTISDEIKLSLYRIAQEHLQHIRNQAHASSLEIRLHDQQARIIFSVRDDGQSLSSDSSLPHIHSIENRVVLHSGIIRYTEEPGNGNLLLVEFPFF